MPCGSWATLLTNGRIVTDAIHRGYNLMPSNIRFIAPPEIAPANGYTHVVEVTNSKTIYISGQVPLDSNGNLVGENNLQEQAQQVFENLHAALTAAGADFGHVVKFTYFLLD